MMHITVATETDDFDMMAKQDLYFDTKHIRRVAPLCEQPEDATLERDLVSCSDIVRYIGRVLETCGNNFEVHYVNVDYLDEFDINVFLKGKYEGN